MLQVVGQYALTIKIDTLPDFEIGTNNFSSFLLVEEAGNYLPTFMLTIKLIGVNERFIAHLNEGVKFKVTMAQDRLGAGQNGGNSPSPRNLISSLKVTAVEVVRDGQQDRILILKGMYDSLGYVNNTHIGITDKTTPDKIIMEIARKYFNSQPVDIEEMKGEQHWIQSGQSDRAFVSDLWLHSDAGEEDTPLLGITSEGQFIMRKLSSVTEGSIEDVDFVFTNFGGSGDTPIISYHPNYVYQDNTTFLNYLLGNQRTKNVIQTEDAGNLRLLESVTKNYLGDGTPFVKSTDSTPRFDSVEFKNENHHKTYFQAFMRNIQFLATYSSIKITLTTDAPFFLIKLFDMVSLVDHPMDIDPKNKTIRNEYISGRYIVTRVARNFTGRTVITVVELMRPSLNLAEGSFRTTGSETEQATPAAGGTATAEFQLQLALKGGSEIPFGEETEKVLESITKEEGVAEPSEPLDLSKSRKTDVKQSSVNVADSRASASENPVKDLSKK